MPSEEEQPLRGGNLHTVVRVGDTVRRPLGSTALAAHAVLAHLQRVGFDGAPRFLGVDEQGREVLSYVPGDVLEDAAFSRMGMRPLVEAARLIRRFHDAAAGFVPPAELSWTDEIAWPGEPRIPCHNDLAPRNTVYRGGRAVALIDWDLVAAGPPIWDLAHAAWHFVPLVDDRRARGLGWTRPPDREARLRRFCDEYGLSDEERPGFTRVVVARMTATAEGIDALAAAGEPAHQRLAADGVANEIRRQTAWLAQRTSLFDEALSGAT